MKVNIIGDVTGFGMTLEALVKEMPTVELWCLGDIVDRGPNSKMALDFLIDNKYNSLMGNHDHLMLFEKIRRNPDVHYRLYPPGCWSWNGGEATARSFGLQYLHEWEWERYPKYYEFIEKMPLKHQIDDLILTHAPIHDLKEKLAFDLKEINKSEFLLDGSILWSRTPPNKIEGKFQVYGHNSTKGILWHTDKYPQGIYMENPLEVPEDAWAVCIDTWREGYLTGLYIDTEKLLNPKEAIEVYQYTIIDPI